MGTLALTKAPDGFYVAGNRRNRLFDVAFSGSYSTGGEVITPVQVGLRKIEEVIAPPTLDGAAGGLVPRWNTTTGKLQFFTSNGASPAVLLEKTAAAYAASTAGRFRFVGQ